MSLILFKVFFSLHLFLIDSIFLMYRNLTVCVSVYKHMWLIFRSEVEDLNHWWRDAKWVEAALSFFVLD